VQIFNHHSGAVQFHDAKSLSKQDSSDNITFFSPGEHPESDFGAYATIVCIHLCTPSMGVN